MLSSLVVFIFNSGKGSPRRNGGPFSIYGKKDERCRNVAIKNLKKFSGRFEGIRQKKSDEMRGRVCLYGIICQIYTGGAK